MYKVIQGGTASLPVVDYKGIYFKALGRVIEQDLNNKDIVKRLVFYGIKYINKEQPCYHSEEELFSIINLIHYINMGIGKLMPIEIMTIFPIKKIYGGKKTNTKDYFYAMDFLQHIGMNEPIGNDKKVMEFLWEYENKNTKFYLASIFTLLDEVKEYQGKISLLKEVMQEHGETTYTYFDEENKTYRMNDKTGDIERIRKPRPRHLKLL